MRGGGEEVGVRGSEGGVHTHAIVCYSTYDIHTIVLYNVTSEGMV